MNLFNFAPSGNDMNNVPFTNVLINYTAESELKWIPPEHKQNVFDEILKDACKRKSHV
jgi:hypothetical protein